MDKNIAVSLIRQYFQSWLEHDLSLFLNTLSPDVEVIECYGPVYFGHQEARDWFVDWHNRPEKGVVTRWEIFNILYDEALNMAAVEWDFECVYDGKPGSFLGTSLVHFDDTKITRLQEYKMDRHHYRPYAEAEK